MRIGLVGAGHMGRLHAEKVVELQQADAAVALAGVHDLHAGRSRELAKRCGVRCFEGASELFADCDAAIVAVPTVEHFAVVKGALDRGCDVLVEKPIAATLDEAESLLDHAHACERILQVGHLEWFNSAMQAMRKRIHRPRFVEAHRLGPFPERPMDIDVVRDLMIHDLDILQQLVGEEPERVEAIGVPVLTTRVDIANARLTYPGGCVANLTASRVSPTPMRKLRFFQRDGYFSIDFLAQTAVVFRRESEGVEGAPEILMDKLDVDRGDALLAQLRAFVDSVRTRVPVVPSGSQRGNGDAAVGALRTALRVIESMPELDDWT